MRRMAVDVKSRAKRYEKLDFLGEGQVRLSDGIRRALNGERQAASHPHRFSGGVERTDLATPFWTRLPRRTCCPSVYPGGEPLRGSVLSEG